MGAALVEEVGSPRRPDFAEAVSAVGTWGEQQESVVYVTQKWGGVDQGLPRRPCPPHPHPHQSAVRPPNGSVAYFAHSPWPGAPVAPRGCNRTLSTAQNGKNKIGFPRLPL